MNRPKVPDVPVHRKKPETVSRKIKGKGKLVSQTELCAYLSIGDTTIKKWAKLGLPRMKEGKRVWYDIGQVTRWMIERETNDLRCELISASQDKGDSMTPIQAKLRKEIAQALTAELDLAIKREQVANIDDLMESFAEALNEVKAKLVSLSSRVSGLLSHQDEEEVAKILDSEISDMLEVLSNYE